SAKIRWCCGVIGWAGAPGGLGSPSCAGTCSRAGGAGGRAMSRAIAGGGGGAGGSVAAVSSATDGALRRSEPRPRNSHPAAITIAASASASTTTRRLEDDLSARKSANATSLLGERPRHRLRGVLPGVPVAVPARGRTGLARRIPVADPVIVGVVVRGRFDRVRLGRERRR